MKHGPTVMTLKLNKIHYNGITLPCHNGEKDTPSV
jgi:hypothetical protein